MIELMIAAISVIPQPAQVKLGVGVVTGSPAVEYNISRDLPAEGYRLEISDGKIVVTSSDEAGRYYAGVTLEQLKETVGGMDVYPAVSIGEESISTIVAISLASRC